MGVYTSTDDRKITLTPIQMGHSIFLGKFASLNLVFSWLPLQRGNRLYTSESDI